MDVTRRKRELDVPWSMEPMRDGDGEDWSVERTDWLTFTLTLHSNMISVEMRDEVDEI